MKYWVLEPEVAGGLGWDCIIDSKVHPPIVERLHYVFDDWLGDEILATFPCFIVTSNVRGIIESSGSSGAVFDFAKVSRSTLFRELNPRPSLPQFWWLKIVGAAGSDDVGLSPNGRLVITDWLLMKLKASCQLDHCELEELK